MSMGNLKTTNRVITLRGMKIQKIQDGRIVEQWATANSFETLLELGALRLNGGDELKTSTT